MLKIVRFVLLAMLIFYVYKRFFKRSSPHPPPLPQQPILKAPCPDLDCDGEVRRLNDKADVFLWKCSKCGKTYNNEAIVLGRNKG